MPNSISVFISLFVRDYRLVFFGCVMIYSMTAVLAQDPQIIEPAQQTGRRLPVHGFTSQVVRDLPPWCRIPHANAGNGSDLVELLVDVKFDPPLPFKNPDVFVSLTKLKNGAGAGSRWHHVYAEDVSDTGFTLVLWCDSDGPKSNTPASISEFGVEYLALPSAVPPVVKHHQWKMKEFLLGSGLGQPQLTDADYADYRDVGFNTVTSWYDNRIGASFKSVTTSLDLAAKHELYCIVNTYAHDGSNVWGKENDHFHYPPPYLQHHPATRSELQVLVNNLKNPNANGALPDNLVGFLLSDDLSCDSLSPPAQRPEVVDAVQWLQKNHPELFAWIDFNYSYRDTLGTGGEHNPKNISIESRDLFDAKILIHSMQIYLTPGNTHKFVANLRQLSRCSAAHDLVAWPVIDARQNVAEDKPNATREAWLRFQAYSSVAYGARGLWYFCYDENDGLIIHQNGAIMHRPLWAVVQKINQSIKTAGPLLMDFNFSHVVENLNAAPIASRDDLISEVSENTLVGIFESQSRKNEPLLVIVDTGLKTHDVMLNLSRGPWGATEVSGRKEDVSLDQEKLLIRDLEPGGARIVQLKARN